VKRLIVFCFLCLFFVSTWGCIGQKVALSTEFADRAIIQKIEQHEVAIAVYYYMDEQEYTKRMQNREPSMPKLPTLRRSEIAIPLGLKTSQKGGTYYTICYIGSGILLKDNHILTVRHLFAHAVNTLGAKIYVFKRGLNHVMEADIVAISEGVEFTDDYAVIKLKEDLGFPGLKIAKKDTKNEPKKGDNIIFGGSVGGVAFFTRYGHLTDFHWFLRKDENDQLHLSTWTDFPFLCVYPGGPGDSGSSIINVRGEIVSLVYIGIENYSEEYLFGNPTSMIWDFLAKHNLQYLGE